MDTGPGVTGKNASRKKRGRRTRRRQDTKAGSGVRVKQLEQGLVSALRETYEEMFGPRTEQARAFALDLKVLIKPGSPWQMEAVPSLQDQIRSAVQEMTTQAEAFRAGRVYCYRCDSSLCPHSIPPHPGSVFGGYSSTGIPLWPDLGQVMLELKHPNIDLLYQPMHRQLVVATMGAEMLKNRQLDVFGKQSKTYDILGQVVFGFLRLQDPENKHRDKERVAFTLQAVESRRFDGSPRMELNVLGRLPGGHAAMDTLKDPYQMRIFNIIASARHRIRNLTPNPVVFGKRRITRLSQENIDPVSNALKNLAKTLEKAGRQRGRRTIHAEGHPVSQRPTASAREDTLSAPDDHFLWDEHRHTVVVVGPRNRVHVFSPQGRHITSIVLEAEAVKKRLRRKRWTRLSGETLQQFRGSVNRKPLNTSEGGVSSETGPRSPPPFRSPLRSKRRNAPQEDESSRSGASAKRPFLQHGRE